jgi:hypothetical protein
MSYAQLQSLKDGDFVRIPANAAHPTYRGTVFSVKRLGAFVIVPSIWGSASDLQFFLASEIEPV